LYGLDASVEGKADRPDLRSPCPPKAAGMAPGQGSGGNRVSGHVEGVPVPVRTRVDTAQTGRKAAGLPDVQERELGPAEEFLAEGEAHLARQRDCSRPFFVSQCPAADFVLLE
jgi:hypothetical protein